MVSIVQQRNDSNGYSKSWYMYYLRFIYAQLALIISEIVPISIHLVLNKMAYDTKMSTIFFKSSEIVPMEFKYS